MDRRQFLRTLGLAAPVAVVAPTYFFAPIGGWHSDVIAHANFYSYPKGLRPDLIDEQVELNKDINKRIGALLRSTFDQRGLSEQAYELRAGRLIKTVRIAIAEV
jgi:hypothetical protein